MYNILVTGSYGQLGSEIRGLAESYPQHQFFFTGVETLDITDQNAISLFVQGNKITAIINCAAYTAVDKAESEPKLADKINNLSVQYLAETAKVYNCKFIHISTDYVFDGNSYKPYEEINKPNPQSVYGNTKLAGEQALQRINPENCIIIRTSWVYSTFGNNFVKTMLRLGQEKDEINVVADQFGTPTYARDLAHAILQIVPQIENKATVIYHYTNEGTCSWAGFAIEIFKMADISCKVNRITTIEYPTPAKRPANSVLNKKKIKAHFGISIPNWEDGLKRMLGAHIR